MSGRREIVRVSPTLVVSRDYNPASHGDPQYRGGYLLLLPGKVPEIVLDGLATAEEQREAEARCLQTLQERRAQILVQSPASPDQSGDSRRPEGSQQSKGLVGQRLVAAGLLTVSNLQKILERQKGLPAGRPVRRLGSLLVEENLLTMRQAAEALAEQRGVPPVTSYSARVDPTVANLFPREVLERLQAAPVCLVGKTVGVAMVDPRETAQVEELQALTQYTVRPMLAPQLHVQKLLEGLRSSRSSVVRQPAGTSQRSGPAAASSPATPPPAGQSADLSLASPAPAGTSSPQSGPASPRSLASQLASQGSRPAPLASAQSSTSSPPSRKSAEGKAVPVPPSGASSPVTPASAASAGSGQRSQRSLRRSRRTLTGGERTLWLIGAVVAIIIAVAAGFLVKLRHLSGLQQDEVAATPPAAPANPSAPDPSKPSPRAEHATEPEPAAPSDPAPSAESPAEGE